MLQILFVCSKNSGRVAPFIVDQAESLEKAGCRVEFYTIEGKGFVGYLKNYRHLVRKIREFSPDIVHAHYGLSGLLANLQRKVPVVTTYHGSDINNPRIFLFSRICMLLSAHNIFVSQKNKNKSRLKSNASLLPCGVDTELFVPLDKQQARAALGFGADEKLVLFAGAFANEVKNAGLAVQAVNRIPEVRLLELKGYTRQQVAQLMCAVDVALMTSFSEGSPQFIKEAMACNCPVVSVDVGDVAELIEGVDGCCIVPYDADKIAQHIQPLLHNPTRTNGRDRIVERQLQADKVAQLIVECYRIVISDER